LLKKSIKSAIFGIFSRPKFYRFGLKKTGFGHVLTGICPEKFFDTPRSPPFLGKIWYRGNFWPNVVILCSQMW
jgi:hypothetical protein